MRKLSLFSLLLIIVCQLAAQRVSENQAMQACQRFLMERNHATLADDVKLAEYSRLEGAGTLMVFQPEAL